MLVNPARVEALCQEIGEDDFPEVLEMFLSESAQVVARLQEAADPAAVSADMHFLKGSALTMGLDDLAAFCLTAEQGAALDPVALADLFERSRAALLALKI